VFFTDLERAGNWKRAYQGIGQAANTQRGNTALIPQIVSKRAVDEVDELS
jgi:hypothetical protein